MRYRIVLHESDEGFSVSVPGLPGCHSQGDTEAEAIENIKIAIVEYLEVLAELTQGENVREVDVMI
jgi:predicted RNase H-like HicB family nuclease